jgi:hypothetical protein
MFTKNKQYNYKGEKKLKRKESWKGEVHKVNFVTQSQKKH